MITLSNIEALMVWYTDEAANEFVDKGAITFTPDANKGCQAFIRHMEQQGYLTNDGSNLMIVTLDFDGSEQDEWYLNTAGLKFFERELPPLTE